MISCINDHLPLLFCSFASNAMSQTLKPYYFLYFHTTFLFSSFNFTVSETVTSLGSFLSPAIVCDILPKWQWQKNYTAINGLIIGILLALAGKYGANTCVLVCTQLHHGSTTMLWGQIIALCGIRGKASFQRNTKTVCYSSAKCLKLK